MSLVEDFMNTAMVRRGSKDSILELSRVMTDWKISSIAITDEQDKRVVGIVTERDIVHCIAKGIRPEETIANSLMSTNIISISRNQPIEDAARLMIKNRVRHLLVEDSYHQIVGIMTTTDLARYLKQNVRSEKLSKGELQPAYTELLSEVWELFF